MKRRPTNRPWPYASAVFLVVGLCATVPALPGTVEGPQDEQAVRPDIAGRRVVKHFDFNEEPLGNYDDRPMYWRRHGEAGFTPLLEGVFDRQVGHASAPSFRLSLDGGSIAYHYPDPAGREGRDIAVRTNSDYLLVAYVRTDSLTEARAYITAYYLDRKGRRIAGTQRVSPLIGGSGKPTDWERITVALPGGVPGSRYVGISLWLTQACVWSTSPRPKRHIEHLDIDGAAWFDDITVYRMPRVKLATGHEGNVFTEHEPVEIMTEVNDPDGLHLEARLEIRDARDRVVISEDDIPIHGNDGSVWDTFSFNDLDVGHHTAELTVSAEGAVLVRRALQFIRIAEPVSPPMEMGRGFGIVLKDIDRALFPGQKELLKQLQPECVKLPVWYAQDAVLGLDRLSEPLDDYLEAIVGARSEPIGIMMDAPDRGRTTDHSHILSMVDVFSGQPQGWKPFIAGLWSRHAGLIQVWQFGGEGDTTVFLDDRLSRLIPSLYSEMLPLMSQALIAVPGSAGYEPLPADYRHYMALMVPCAIPPDAIAEHLEPYLQHGRESVWATIEPLPERSYPRLVRLTDLSRRLVEAYYQNVHTVFMRAPWTGEQDLLASSVNPSEDYIVLRTVSDVLGGSEPLSKMTLYGTAECVVFDRNAQAILFVWDDSAPPEGRELSLVLGEDARQVDLWGRMRPLRTVGGEQIIRVGRVPTFIVHTPTWLIEFRRQFRVEPEVFEASYETRERDIVFTNTHHEAISGMLRLVPPADWDVRPNRMSFLLGPGEEFRKTVSIRFPANAEAGVTPLIGEFELDADRRYRILTPAWFDLGLSDVDLETAVFRHEEDVYVRVTLINRSSEPVRFDGQLLSPGRPPITRLFASFQPGQSVTKDFVLKDGAQLSGAKVRINLKEVRGRGRIWNRIVPIP